MKLPILASIALATLTSACATAPQRPAMLASLTMADGPAVDAPAGYLRMCEVTPEACSTGDAHASIVGANMVETSAEIDVAGADPTIETVPVVLSFAAVAMVTPAPDPIVRAINDRAMGRLLQSVNRRVNGRVRQRTDDAIYGISEVWRRSGTGRDAQGDCEDLAIEKREQLIAAGVSRDMLFYATAYREDLGLHTVLVARTAKGDMVLDSRSPFVQLWNTLPYDWVSRQNPDSPMQWSMILDPRRVAQDFVATGAAIRETAALQ